MHKQVPAARLGFLGAPSCSAAWRLTPPRLWIRWLTRSPTWRSTRTLLHPASGSVGDSEEEEAVQAAAPAPAPAAAANRGRGRSAKGAGAPGKGRGGKARPAAAAAGQKYPWVDASTHTFAPRAEYAGKEAWEPARKLWDLNYKSPPHEIFALVDAPDSEYELRAVNSERYRTYAR